MFIYISVQFMYLANCKLNVNNNLRVRANIFVPLHTWRKKKLKNQTKTNVFCFYINSFTRGHSKGYIIHNKTVDRVFSYLDTILWIHYHIFIKLYKRNHIKFKRLITRHRSTFYCSKNFLLYNFNIAKQIVRSYLITIYMVSGIPNKK